MPKYLLAVIALAVALALPATASADACPGGLKVDNVAVTGADCNDLGAGGIEIDTPHLLTNEVVEIRGKMNLNVGRTLLTQKTAGVPLVAAVRDSGGAYQPFMLGTYKVGEFQVCELFKGFTPDTGFGETLGNTGPSGIALQTNDRLDIALPQVACATQPALDVTQPVLKFVGKLLGLSLSGAGIFSTGDGVSVALPTRFGLDEQRGGRVFGNFTAQVPLPRSKRAELGVTAEISRDNGLKPVSLSGAYLGVIDVVPGVSLVSPAILLAPVNKRYGGRLGLSFPLDLAAGGAEILVEDGDLKRIGFDLGLPPPGLPIPPPSPSSVPLLTISSFGATLVTASTADNLPVGGVVAQRGSFQGRASFVAGPLIAVPGGAAQALTADLDITISGPTVQLRGTVFAVNKFLRLGSARLQIGADPFRMEAEANVVFPNTGTQIITGNVFAGVTGTAFTGLGTFTLKVPNAIPVIGGQQIAGASGVVSNKGVGGVISVDAPLLKPRTIGVGFKFGGGFDFIDSLTPLITLTPTPISFRPRFSGVTRQATGDVSNGFTLTERKGDLAVVVERSGGSGDVSITGPDGKPVKTAELPSNTADVVNLGLGNPGPGTYKVNGAGITKVTVATIDDPSYLDPRAGWGSRPKPPIRAGRAVPVCWDIKHAPAGAVVDLFEDTNGFAATGRDIATELPASGCFNVPTDDWEPGRHWVYGNVRVGDTTLNIRYWPIAITVSDPKRIAAPRSVKAKPTKDGARVTWRHVNGSTGYQVTALPVNPQDAPLRKEIVSEESVTLPLRGAREWTVSVQALDARAHLGNVSKPLTTSALVPVVLAGRPNGTPQVGQPWAFQLDTENLSSLSVLKAPKGTRLNRAKALLTWTPAAKAGTVDPQVLRVRGCTRDRRCVTQEWKLAAYPKGFAPVGPARSFKVLDSVVKPGETIELRAQGLDQAVTVKVDGRRVK